MVINTPILGLAKHAYASKYSIDSNQEINIIVFTFSYHLLSLYAIFHITSTIFTEMIKKYNNQLAISLLGKHSLVCFAAMILKYKAQPFNIMIFLWSKLTISQQNTTWQWQHPTMAVTFETIAKWTKILLC